jgi:hypothetical protein
MRLTIPVTPSHIAILWMRVTFSTGIHTFILVHRLAPVKIERNIKKNPVRPKNPRILYAISASDAMMRIRVVNLIEKARPTRNPDRAIRI